MTSGRNIDDRTRYRYPSPTPGRSLMFLLVPFALLAVSCGGQGGSGSPDPEASVSPATDGGANAKSSLDATGLLGDWVKDPSASAGACADYPDTISFTDYGYLTSLHDDRAPVIDGGSYEIDGSTLRLSNPLDAMVDFDVMLTEETLVIVPGDGGCRVTYRRP